MSREATTKASQRMTLEERRAFLKLPIEERRRRMTQLAEQMVEHYQSAEETAQRQAWQGGDIVE